MIRVKISLGKTIENEQSQTDGQDINVGFFVNFGPCVCRGFLCFVKQNSLDKANSINTAEISERAVLKYSLSTLICTDKIFCKT